MVQLILDVTGANISLPESKKGGYSALKEDLGEEVQMINGRIVKEVRGSVWRVSYQYGYFNDETRKALMEVCEKGRKSPISCSFLPQESDGALTTSSFFITAFTRPKFMWSTSRNGAPKPMWGDFSIELREVQPSD